MPKFEVEVEYLEPVIEKIFVEDAIDQEDAETQAHDRVYRASPEVETVETIGVEIIDG